MNKDKQHFIGIVRADLLSFLVSNAVAEAHGVFDRQNDPEGAIYLEKIYNGTNRAILSAIKSGGLHIRAWPLWNKIPIDEIEEGDDAHTATYGIAISDLHDWLQTTGYPLAKTPQSLYEVFKRGWADIYAEIECTTVNPAGEPPFEVVGFGGVQHGKKAGWYKDNKDDFIRAALADMQGQPTGEGTEKQRIIKWIVDKEGGSDETWMSVIKTADIARVKNEKREN